MAKVGRMKLGSQGLEVSEQALGCMGMSALYGPPKPEPDMIALIHHAVRCGLTFLDTSDVYGPHTNEILLGKALKGGVREKVELATKFGVNISNDGKREIRGDPAYVRAACEGSLKRLHIALIALISITSIELILAFRLKSRRAIGVVAVVRDVEEDIVPTCRELGIGIVAYSPLGRGFLSSGAKLIENLPDRDHRKECTPSQLALAWVHHQENDVCPIPGTTKLENFNQNISALSVKFAPQEMAELESFAATDSAKGERYGNNIATWKTSHTPPLSFWKAL
ncbi:hypothetical protein PIB30_064087 [Stylosanthes scabra]|uniref:NADP-dependent oxidoreductase domain-containing protein n=1 Tax=Stylosanthes scabra TaxID=79078 RepID=A0ABU6WL76_9FABA|nr:hypothetical protein [Stylosanthes scabra]